MGFLDKIKSVLSPNTVTSTAPNPQNASVVGLQKSKSGELSCHQNGYNTSKSYEGTPFERAVITFDERKKTCIPSRTGLYVAEILLLEYCSYGTYPAPKNGYPRFWWFEYGISNVEAALSSLEKRGYIMFDSAANSLRRLTVAELQAILQQKGLPANGKKAELVERVKANTSEAELISYGLPSKYILTELGKAELEENAYVPYMHKTRYKTTEGTMFGTEFNVWSINKLLNRYDKSNWKNIVDQEESKLFEQRNARQDTSMYRLSDIDPLLEKTIKEQDKQLEQIQQAEAELGGDITALIEFWEKLWKDNGLLFGGSKWHFRLPDLYIKVHRYDDALAFCKMIKKKRPEYAARAESYISKIEEKKEKLSKSKATKA